MIEIRISKESEPGTIYFIPTFVRCKYCNHEIPIRTVKITGMVDCNGGCSKRSSMVDYVKIFGIIKNVT